ncbi:MULTISPECIES: hypothetical protein [Nostocaceae]|uniref:Uncharacterized protein n=1 Tax=Anabaena catenula FACHB-362 TaxID=2692877 RepID=A0ABR8JC32_9NOST|nr:MULTISPECIES: hypothetical protein [Nostocaceae]MBD2627111.1 hypothetical protein [Trichormus variabilis FACHB-164]MBD2695083.1 hypothetical protein [Anabaena catenula FACHB-362]
MIVKEYLKAVPIEQFFRTGELEVFRSDETSKIVEVVATIESKVQCWLVGSGGKSA